MNMDNRACSAAISPFDGCVQEFIRFFICVHRCPSVAGLLFILAHCSGSSTVKHVRPGSLSNSIVP